MLHMIESCTMWSLFFFVVPFLIYAFAYVGLKSSCLVGLERGQGEARGGDFALIVIVREGGGFKLQTRKTRDTRVGKGREGPSHPGRKGEGGEEKEKY